MKREKKGAVFAIAIAVMLLMTMIMVLASTEPNAEKVKLTPSESMTFSVRAIPNELIYDDGEADTAWAWDDNKFAVRFTPPSYPVDLDTARICLRPDWPDGDHEEFAIEVYDDDGPGGAPGTLLGGPVYYTATNWGWNDIDISGLSITIASGDFYIAYHQLTDYPDCEGLCSDEDAPIYERSWDSVGGWTLCPDENYMIRCVVDLPAGAGWTFMVYLDGDNNVEREAIDAFMGMSLVGSTSNVNIVVQFDRISGYNESYGGWTTCKRFLVTLGMTPTAANAIEDLGECNMGDPDTLSDFVEWAMAEYPADNYALILWDHGSGWKKKWVPWKDETGIARGICWDDTNNDHLTLQETEQALTGDYIDVLGYTACLMHMIEVTDQMIGCSEESVGSESITYSWPYDRILSDLTGNPTMSPSTLAQTIVSCCNEHQKPYVTTISAVDEGDVPSLVTTVDNFAQVLIDLLPYPECDYYKIQQARNEAESFDDPNYIDLYHFAELIKLYVPGAGSAAQAVMDKVNSAVYAEAHNPTYPNAHGLSIYFPKEESGYWTSYEGTAFAIETQWDEFLKKYYEGPEYPCCAKAAVCIARVPDPDEILDPLRELRDDYLKEEYVDRYYDYSTELTMAMTKDPALAYEAARLLVKYSPMIEHHVTGTGKVKLITGRDVEEVVSFTDGLKRSVLKNRGEIGATRSQETIKFMDEFKEQVEASEGKTFSEALQSSIYCESEPMPDLVITNIRLDGNKVKYTIKNQGEAATRGLIINTLLVDGVPVSDNLIIWSIQPGQSLEKTFILSRPLKISPNTTIVVCADYENKVPESDEENNCLVLE